MFPKFIRFKNHTVYRIPNDKYTLIIANCKKDKLLIPKEFKDIDCLLMPYNNIIGNLDLSELSFNELNMKILKHGHHEGIGKNGTLNFICDICGKSQTDNECNCA